MPFNNAIWWNILWHFVFCRRFYGILKEKLKLYEMHEINFANDLFV